MRKLGAQVQMQYESTVVKKPWGYEYLVYQNDKAALWFLHINKDQQTSMHCHPNKTTGHILLDGEAELSFLSESKVIHAVSKTMIRKGLFHQTKAISDDGISVFEIETPVDKHDLVRLEDKYGREGEPYEDDSFEVPKKEDCLWVDGSTKTYNFANCKIEVESISDVNGFDDKHKEQNVIFLDGGIKDSKGNYVATSGDVVVVNTIRKLIKLFPYISKETKIMTITHD